MPPRWLSAVIVAFWLCTTGWLLYQDVWPWLQPGQAPPYTIDLEDEVQQTNVQWTVSCNDGPRLRVLTGVKFNKEDDTFDLNAKVRILNEAVGNESSSPLVIWYVDSTYHVTRQGELRTVYILFQGSAHCNSVVTMHGDGTLTGEVREGRFFSHLHAATQPFGEIADQSIDMDLKPVAVSAPASVLSPLHPVNRIAGLHPGQSWRTPLVDPVQDAFAALVRAAILDRPSQEDEDHEVVLTATVRPQPETLTWNGKPVHCLIIDYLGEDFRAVTWVQVGDGKVLRQESEHRGDKMVLQRD